MSDPIRIELLEEERQMMLLALAKLSLERPGWAQWLNKIALKMDNRLPDGSAQMFQTFRSIHAAEAVEE